MKIIPFNKDHIKVGSVLIKKKYRHRGTKREELITDYIVTVKGIDGDRYLVDYKGKEILAVIHDRDYHYIDNSNKLILFFRYGPRRILIFFIFVLLVFIYGK